MCRIILALALLLVPSLAHAHPVDALGDNPQDLTKQYPYAALGLDDPVVFEKRRQFWHHKRELEHKIDLYHQCYGRISLLATQLGYPSTAFDGWFEPQTLNYSAVVPGHPCVNAAHGGIPGYTQLEWCELHREAAEYTSIQMDTILIGCTMATEYLESILADYTAAVINHCRYHNPCPEGDALVENLR